MPTALKIQDIKNSIFYRGDSVPRNAEATTRTDTMLRVFKTDGLLTKALFNGNFSYDPILANLAYYVAAHVGYEKDTPEGQFSKQDSPFLSFAKNDEASARHFLERNKKRKFERCEVFDTEYAMFSLSQLDVTLREIGVYQFNYQRDYVNFQSIRQEYEAKLLTGDLSGLVTFTLMDAVIKANSDNGFKNVALLIDVVDYISNNPKSNTLDALLKKNTLERATQSNEWLLLPFDIQPGEGIVTPRLSPNKYLKIEFRLKAVTPPV